MPTSTPPQASPVSAPQQPPRQRTGRHLRPGYLASLVCLTVAVLLSGTLLVVGTDAPHPEPDFIAGPKGEDEFIDGLRTDVDFEIEVGEEDLGEVAVFHIPGESGSCVLYPPSGDRSLGDFASSPTQYGTQNWEVWQVHEFEMTGTHLFQCSDRVGIASADTIDAARTRQFVWAVLWLSMPLPFLAAAITALVTFVRSRRERATHPTGH